MKSCCDGKTEDLLKLKNKQAHILKIVMGINITMFAVEFAAGASARSSSLMADSLDMLGDAIVYAFSLYVLHKSVKWRSMAALLKGLIITAFGLGVLVETTTKLFTTVIPVAQTMGLVGALALAANASCLLLLMRHRNDDLNMRSTWICSRNDIISNVGVLVAAYGVRLTDSKWPDVTAGYIIGGLFLRSAWPILMESILSVRSENAKQSV